MKSKQYAIALLGMALMVMVTGRAWATTNSANNQDSLTITILPNIDRGVSIDTNTEIMDLGTVDLGVTTQTVRPATVTILGSMSSDGSQTTGQELDLSLTFSPVGGWSLDTSPTIDSTSNETDAIAVYALFSDTTLSLAPTAAQFVAENGAFTTTLARAGGGVGNGTRFEKTGGGALPGDGMDHLSTGDKAHLWMLFRLPNVTTVTDAQEITLTATAVNAN